MSSPFPGMDPYLEKHWGDVHTRLILYSADQLQALIPSELRARVEERVVLETPRRRSIYPDVRVFERKGFESKGKPPRGANGALAVAVAQPLVIEISDEPQTQRFVEIRDPTSGGKLVTVIEVLSPSNKKPGDPQEQYLRKQRELIQGGVSLVEIDLLRDGDWILAMPDWAAEQWPSTYRVGVRRAWNRGQAEYYPIQLQDKLPTIGIPLRKKDADAPLNLQTLIELCYQNGGYDDINYNARPEPPLAPKDARWAHRLLRDKGLRSRRRKKKPS